MLRILHVHFRMSPARKNALTADRHISKALENYSKYENHILVEEDLGDFGYTIYSKLSKIALDIRRKFEKKFYHLSKAPTILFPFILFPLISYTLYKKFKEYDIVVLHGHRVIVFIGCLGGIVLTKILNRFTNKKTKFIFHAHNSYSAIFTILRRMYLSFSNLLMDGIIFMTNDDMEKCKALVRKPAFVLYNPVPEDIIKTKIKGESKRNIDFLFVSRYSKHKRADLLLKAVEKAEIPKNKKLKVRLIGSVQDAYEYVKNLAEEINKKNKKVNIEVLSNVPWKVIKESYENAKWFVFPSTEREGFPIVLLEAMAHGIPIICSDYPMYREIGYNSFIYFKNTTELTEIITKILYNQIEWEKWSKKSYQLRKRYLPQKIAKEFDKKIRQVIIS